MLLLSLTFFESTMKWKCFRNLVPNFYFLFYKDFFSLLNIRVIQSSLPVFVTMSTESTLFHRFRKFSYMKKIFNDQTINAQAGHINLEAIGFSCVRLINVEVRYPRATRRFDVIFISRL